MHATAQLFLGMKLADICSCSVVMTIKHLESLVADVMKEINGSQSPLKIQMYEADI